jgi:hypothetical protein
MYSVHYFRSIAGSFGVEAAGSALVGGRHEVVGSGLVGGRSEAEPLEALLHKKI